VSASVPILQRADAYLSHYAQERPHEAAWIDATRSISFVQADNWVQKIALSLVTSGVMKGQNVAVYGKPSPEFMALFLAISSVGAIYVGLNPKYTECELRAILRDCRPVLVFNLIGDAPEHFDKLAAALSCIACDQVGALEIWLKLASARNSVAADRLATVRGGLATKDVALLVYTSGSTGAAKGAQLTHLGIVFVAPITNDIKNFGVHGKARALCNLPINHVGCVVDICTNTLIAGGALVFQADFDPEAMLAAVEAYQLTSWGGVPAMYMAIVQLPRFRTANYTSLQKIIVAGNSAPQWLINILMDVTQRQVMNGYGLTEAMGFSTFTQSGDSAETVSGTVGRFDSRIEWRLGSRREHKKPVNPLQGEIQIRGEWLFSGYFGNKDATEKAFTPDGWFKTGDVANLLPDGNIKLVGRIKEIFKSGGYNVYPLEIEQVLEAFEHVVIAVVVDVPDTQYAEVGCAYLVSKNTNLNVTVLKEALRTRLANYKIPKYFEIVEDLPLLPVGKVDRVALRQRAAGKYYKNP
jgi:acyl-CoA synthetase (AMP-forming)/AMP-acid ligase II